MSWLWPIRTGQTVFDVWFVIHFCFWVFAGAQLQAFSISRSKTLAIMFVVAGAWELFERFAEQRWTAVWHHPESWVNSIIGDVMLAGVFGALLGFWLAEHQ